MRIYIGYKYRYLTDKESLKSELQQISDFFESLGHKAFILGRDIQKWDNHKYSKVNTTLQIIKYLGQHDVLFVYLNSDVHSNGLPVEIALAKVYGLKIIIAKHKSVKGSILPTFANTLIEFDTLEDLKSKAAQVLK